MLLSLTLCEGIAYGGKRVVLFKRIDWPSAPPEGAVVFCGRSEDEEETGYSAVIRRVYWQAGGDISVEAEDEQLRGEYDDIVADLKRDGFMEYEEFSNWDGS